MAKNKEYSSENAWRQYGSKIKRRPFQLLRNCQQLAASIENATAKCEKNYRQGIVAELRENACQLIYETRKANFSRLGTKDRMEAQKRAEEYIDRIYDLIPVTRMCRCMTPAQEGVIEKELCLVKAAFEAWIQSDSKRLFGEISHMAKKILENTRAASDHYKNLDLKYELSLLEKICSPSGMNEDVMLLATVIHQINNEHFKMDEFFLMNFSKEKRFTFGNKQWTSFFAVQAVTEFCIQTQYKDSRGFFYETDSINNAILLFSKPGR